MQNSEETYKISWSYYVARHKGKVIFFDCGFRDKEVAKQWGIRIRFTGAEKELPAILEGGFGAADIVFITHSHPDHIDNLDLFSNPTIIISEKEYHIALESSPQPVQDKLLRSRVVKVEDEYIYDDFFRYKVIGGHTLGSSVVYFSNQDKDYVITGDECYLRDNLFSQRPIGIRVNEGNNEKFLVEGKQKGYIPLPYHDLSIYDDYEHVSDHIVRIV